MTDPVVAVRGVHKAYGATGPFGRRGDPHAHAALSGIDLEIGAGECVGILGRNGAGKSTLLQLLAGTLTPTTGTVQVRGRVSALLELGAGFNPEWTGRENAEFYCMIQGAARGDAAALTARVAAFADVGVFFDRPVRTYSTGMFLRVAFAAAIALEPEVLVIDEALAVGDANFQNKCFAHLRAIRSAGRTVVFVTHDVDLVTRFCTRAVVLEHGRLVFDGGPLEAARHYQSLLYRAAPAIETPPEPGRLESQPSYNPHETRIGSAIGTIVDVELVGPPGRPGPHTLDSGDALTVVVHLRALRTIREPSYGLSIRSTDHVLIYGITNLLLGHPMPPLEAGESLVVSFVVPLPLAAGTYFLEVGIADVRPQLEVLDWRSALARLTIRHPGEVYGFSDLGASFTARSP